MNIMYKVNAEYRLQSKQWLAALAATLAMISVGTEEFWLVMNLKHVTNINVVPRNKTHYLWAGLLVAAVSSFIGTFIGAVLADRFGRKKVLLATSISVTCQIVGSFSANGILSCVSLCLGQIGSGIIRVVVPLYVSEIADDHIRGALLMLQLPFYYIGKLIAYGLGNPVSAEVEGVISLIIIVIFLVTFTRFPETPYYLSSKKRDDAATRSLAFYKGIETITAEEEIELIMRNVDAKGSNEGCCGKIQELSWPTNRKSLMIIMFLIIVQWTERIFNSRDIMVHVVAGALVSEEFHAKIVAHGISLITSLLIVFTIDIIGRRSFLSVSSFLGFIIIITTYIILRVIGHMVWVYTVGDIVLHFCEIIIFSVLTVYIGELFTANVKSLAIAIVAAFNLLISFVVLVFSEIFEGDANSDIGCTLLLFAFPIIFVFIPETKRKSSSDIQKELAVTFHSKWIRNKFNPITDLSN